MSHIGDDNPDAPDAALLGPGTTATGGGTSQHAIPESADGEDHIRPVRRPSPHENESGSNEAE
jgi:hypothetical protein